MRRLPGRSNVTLDGNVPVGLNFDRYPETSAKRFSFATREVAVLPDTRQPDALLGIIRQIYNVIGPGFDPIAGKGCCILSDPAAVGQMIEAQFFPRILAQPFLPSFRRGQNATRPISMPSCIWIPVGGARRLDQSPMSPCGRALNTAGA